MLWKFKIDNQYFIDLLKYWKKIINLSWFVKIDSEKEKF